MEDAVFKGMARQTRYLGVPLPFLMGIILMSFVIVGVAFAVLGFAGVLSVVLVVPMYVIARIVTKDDDLALRQWRLWFRTKFANRMRGGFTRWGGSSYSPIEYSPARKWRKYPGEKPASSFLPYSHPVTDTIVATNDFRYLSVWSVEGRCPLGVPAEEYNKWKDELSAAFCAVGSPSISFWRHMWHRKVSDAYPEGDFDDWFSRRLNDEYRSLIDSSDLLRTDYLLTVVYSPTGGSPLEAFAKFEPLTLSERRERGAEAIRALDEANMRLEQSLSRYGAKLLLSDGREAQHMAALARPFTAGRDERVSDGTRRYLEKMVAGIRATFHPKSNVGVITENGQSKVFGTIELIDYPETTEAGKLNALLSVPHEFVLTDSFAPSSMADALEAVRRQTAYMAQTRDVALGQREQLTLLPDHLRSGQVCLGEHHMTITAYGDDVSRVRKALAKIAEVASLQDVKFAAGDEASEASFAAQFPGNFDARPHPRVMTSRNAAGLCSFHTVHEGKRSGNPWGPAVALLRTTSGTPYYFNFHDTPVGEDWTGRRVPGNGLFLGMTGSGKTSALTFILSQSGRVRPRALLLDVRQGMSVFVRAVGGHYESMVVGEPSGVNEMQMDPTPLNVMRMNDYVRGLIELDGEGITHDDNRLIASAVDAVTTMLPLHQRRIGRLLNYLDPVGLNGRPSIHDRLLRWCEGGAFGWAADNPSDLIDFDANRINGIDVTEIIKSPELRRAIMPALLRKADDAMLSAEPFILVIDECHNLLDDPYMQPYLRRSQREIRARNGSIVLCTQEAGAIARSALGPTITEQMAFLVAMHNARGKREDYEALGVPEDEFELLQDFGETSRHALIRQGGKSVIVDFSLPGMGKWLSVLSGTTDNAARYDEIVQRLGTNDPEVVLPVYFGEALGQERRMAA